MTSAKVNLLFLACAFILLYVSVTPVEAEACGYHYHINQYYTVYYTGGYKRFHPLYYGFCRGGIWYKDASVYNTSGQRLYYIITYAYSKRSSSTGEVVRNKLLIIYRYIYIGTEYIYNR
eukprot:XP_011454293.1 PREDICTED: uncharacterized protein LOC105347094 [Crassostrea gigas]